MAGRLLERVRCWLHGHTYAMKFRANNHGLPVAGYECVSCMKWKRSPFGD